MNRRWMLKIIILALTVLQCLFIFSMSAAPADVSQDMSGSITYRVADLIVRNLEHMDAAARQQMIEQIDHFIRKTAHFTEYALLGGLLMLDMNIVLEKASAAFAGLAWMLGTLFAASDEWHQTFVEGRSGQVTDVILDSLGVAAGVLIVCIIARTANRRKVSHG